MSDKQFNGKQVHIPTVGQPEPMAIVVRGPEGKPIVLACVAAHAISDGAVDAVGRILLPQIQAIVRTELERLFTPAASSGTPGEATPATEEELKA